MAAEVAMTIAEWAALIRVSPVTAWRRARDGQVAVINVGSKRRPQLRVTESAHRAYLATRQVAGVPST